MKLEIRKFLGFIVLIVISRISFAGQTCNASGIVEYRPSGCDTLIRTCCANKEWSNWGEECLGPQSCTSNQCWDGSKCLDEIPSSRNCVGNIDNSISGIQTRTVSCITGFGWQYTNWLGNCICAPSYGWYKGYCKKTSFIPSHRRVSMDTVRLTITLNPSTQIPVTFRGKIVCSIAQPVGWGEAEASFEMQMGGSFELSPSVSNTIRLPISTGSYISSCDVVLYTPEFHYY